MPVLRFTATEHQHQYNENVYWVTISSTVTSIGGQMFSYEYKLVLPDEWHSSKLGGVCDELHD